MLFVIIVACGVVLFGVVAFFGAPYVPSHSREVRRAFSELRPLTSRDVVVDLGSGDGRVLRIALRQGARRGVGYELHPLLVAISRLVLLRRPATVQLCNMWHAVLPHDATVVYAFTVGRDTKRLVALLQRWADDTGKSFDVIVYGHELPGMRAVKRLRAHTLYKVEPAASLHHREP